MNNNTVKLLECAGCSYRWIEIGDEMKFCPTCRFNSMFYVRGRWKEEDGCVYVFSEEEL